MTQSGGKDTQLGAEMVVESLLRIVSSDHMKLRCCLDGNGASGTSSRWKCGSLMSMFTLRTERTTVGLRRSGWVVRRV